MSFTIQRAEAADADALLQYLKQVGAETDNLTFGPEGVPYSPEEEATYLAAIAHSCDDIMLLAKEDGKIVGTASLSRLPRRMAHRGDLSVTVRKSHWNRGIGSQLLQAIFAFAADNGFTIIDLQVRSDNLRAIGLYRKFGFETIGSHPAFFQIDGEPVAFDYMFLRIP